MAHSPCWRLAALHLARVVRYSAIAPLILPACAAYFALASVVYRRSWQNLEAKCSIAICPDESPSQSKSLAILAALEIQCLQFCLI